MVAYVLFSLFKAMPCPQTVIPHAVLDPTRDHYVFKDFVKVTCIEGYEIVRVSSPSPSK